MGILPLTFSGINFTIHIRKIGIRCVGIPFLNGAAAHESRALEHARAVDGVLGLGKAGIKVKISTKGRYALRLMLDLAIEDTGGPVSLKDIALRQQISGKYLEQIISLLNKAGFVRSVRGAQGGYLLSKAPSEYTVGMILRLTEGDLAPVSCVGENSTGCGRRGVCAAAKVWEQINDAVNQVIDHITLADLVRWHYENQAEE